MRVLYNTSLLTESQAFLKSMNSWCTVSCYSHFFFPLCLMNAENLIGSWTVMLNLKPVIPNNFISVWTHLERRIFDKIVYQVDSSDVSLPARVSSAAQSVSICLTFSLLALFFLPWKWRRNVPLKCRFKFNRYGPKSQKMAFFLVTAVKTSNPTIWLWVFPFGDVQVYLWMLQCGNIVLLTVRFLDVAKCSALTSLSLVISR
jgi:hypothetical protein